MNTVKCLSCYENVLVWLILSLIYLHNHSESPVCWKMAFFSKTANKFSNWFLVLGHLCLICFVYEGSWTELINNRCFQSHYIVVLNSSTLPINKVPYLKSYTGQCQCPWHKVRKKLYRGSFIFMPICGNYTMSSKISYKTV